MLVNQGTTHTKSKKEYNIDENYKIDMGKNWKTYNIKVRSFESI